MCFKFLDLSDVTRAPYRNFILELISIENRNLPFTEKMKIQLKESSLLHSIENSDKDESKFWEEPRDLPVTEKMRFSLKNGDLSSIDQSRRSGRNFLLEMISSAHRDIKTLEKMTILLKNGNLLPIDDRLEARNCKLELLSISPRIVKNQGKMEIELKKSKNRSHFPRANEKIEPIIESLKSNEKMQEKIKLEEKVLRNFDRVVMHKETNRNVKNLRKFRKF